MFLVAIFILASVVNVMTEEQKDTIKARNIPGINVPDPYSKGCVSCHKNNPEMRFDGRLSAILHSWNDAVDAKVLAKAQTMVPEGVILQGKHAFRVTPETSIPEACNKCHGKIKSAPRLFQLLHKIHLTGNQDNLFMTKFQGECTYCHKFDTRKGIWSIVSAKEGE